MSSSKYIIGLGTTVPSTRVLKPPGGDSSDLFGLKTRQKALIEYVKKRAISVENSKILDLIKIAKAQNIIGENDLQTPKTSLSLLDEKNSYTGKQQKNDLCGETLSCNLKRSEGKENLLDVVYNSSPVDKELSPNNSMISPKSSETTAKKALKSNRNSVPSFKSKDITQGFSHQENSKVSPDKKSSPKGDKAKNVNSSITKQKDYISANIKSITQGKPNNTKEKSPVPPTETKIVPEQSRTFIRNPITGTVTEVKGKGIWNTMKVSCDNLNDSTSYEIKRCNQIYTPRNPITGEGTRDDSNYYKFVPRGIRVIQPPGGISYGIY